MAGRGDPEPAVPSITNAPAALSQEISARARRYLISMAIRTGCFIAAILTSGPVRYSLLVGAVLLPYIAVVIANAGREPNRSASVSYLPNGPAALPPPTTRGIPAQGIPNQGRSSHEG